MGLLADAFGEGSILIKDSVDNRSAAIQLAGELLVQSGKAKPSYVSSMLEAVERFGPYIVIAPGIALAHGKPSEDVIETGLSLLVLKQAIEFQHSQNDPVQLVFGLAATVHESHLENHGTASAGAFRSGTGERFAN
jgi:ascorbate PTS system EIIA or EIIAB component